MANRACYRDLRNYKYQLVNDYTLAIDLRPEADIRSPFVELTTTGQLTIQERYAWDGPSGPTVDTRTFMRGSLVHDALYQLMRLGLLDYKKHREYADDLLKKICLEDGMWSFRAWYVHKAVRLFAEGSAKPAQPSEPVVTCVP